MKPEEMAQFVEQATKNRSEALRLIEEAPGWAASAQVLATIYLADMVAAVFAALPEATK